MTRKSRRELERELDDLDGRGGGHDRAGDWRRVLNGELSLNDYTDRWGGQA
mgnify:CR=1 FL=1